jgi:hypothetical protein
MDQTGTATNTTQTLNFPMEVEIRIKIKACDQDDYEFLTKSSAKRDDVTIVNDLKEFLSLELGLELLEVNGVKVSE